MNNGKRNNKPLKDIIHSLLHEICRSHWRLYHLKITKIFETNTNEVEGTKENGKAYQKITKI